MARLKTKRELVDTIRNLSLELGSISSVTEKLNRDNLVSALVFIQKAKDILTKK